MTLDEALELSESLKEEITVDYVSKTMIVPDVYKTIGVQGDDNSRRIYFRIKKMPDDFDLSKGKVQIPWVNANGDERLYEVDDVEQVDDELTFSMLIPYGLAYKEGTVIIGLCVKDDTHDWNISPSEFLIGAGLHVEPWTEIEKTPELYYTKKETDEKFVMIDEATGMYLTNNDANRLYLKKTDAQSTYETKTNVSAVSSKVTSLQSDMASAKVDISAAKTSIDALQTKTTSLEVKTTGIESDLADLEERVTDIENDLESKIITHYLAQRDGRIYSTKLWKVSANPTNVGIKLDSNADLVCEPSTDTVEGRDDYANIPLFQWSHCNFKVDENGKKIPTVLEGAADYKTTGDAEVGTIFMTPYYRVQEFDDYYIWSISDTKHEGFIEPLDAQGKPYIVVGTYTNGTATDGMLRSQPGLRPKAFTSANSLNQDIKKKGWSDGGTNDYILIAYLMNVIKYGNKNSQVTMKGCVNYSWQYNPAEKSSVAGNTFTVTKAEGNNILLGSMVQLGYQNPTSDSTDRGNATMYELGFRQVLAIEPGEETTVITLDGEPFVTADKVSGEKSYPLYMSSYFWKTGTTDKVIGHHDGSYISNTNEKYPCRIHGIELMLGCWEVTTDVAVTLNAQNERNLYRRPLGTAFTTSQATVESTYDYVGKYHQYGDTTDDYWIGDVVPMSDTLVPVDDTSTHTYGVGDRFYYGGTATSGAREVLSFGCLWYGSYAGFACVHLWNALTTGSWLFAGRS